MKEYGRQTFGELNAQKYDEEHDPGTTTESVEFLAPLCDKKKVLELAIGTGRMAIPLHTRGIDVHGIDASPDMLANLKSKPDGANIPASVADMATFELEERFDFAYLVFNTLLNLTSQEAQIDCFARVAQHLNPRGQFLVETIVPDLSEFENLQYLKTDEVGFGSVSFQAAKHDPVSQLIERQSVRITEDGAVLKPFVYRYAWPQEIDLMARLAGFKLENRWGDWHGGPFNARSRMHVSLYQLTATEMEGNEL